MGYAHVDKKCGACLVLLPVAAFYQGSDGRRDGYCKPCRRAKDRKRNANRNVVVASRKQADPNYYRAKKLLRLYGITVAQYDEMHEAQGGVCKICQLPEARALYGSIAYLVVDHDHQTGKVRSLLCHRCNTALGAVENESFRLKALAYLERFK